MSDLGPVLAPGIGVRPWRHYFGNFDLASRVALHPGAHLRGLAIEAALPLRRADADEIERLDASSRPDEPAIEIFTAPAFLRETFEALDPDELPAPGADPASGGWRAFAADAVAFFAHVEAPLPRPYRLVLDVRDPEQTTPLLSGGPARLLLGGDVALCVPRPAEHAMSAYVNIGSVAAAIVFWNIPIPVMAVRLAAEGVAAPPDVFSMVCLFAQRFGGCPLTRLSLAPGEGVFVPLGLVAHDLDPSGATDLVVAIAAIPGA